MVRSARPRGLLLVSVMGQRVVCRDIELPFFVYVRDNELRGQLYDENKWFLTEGDYDTICTNVLLFALQNEKCY